MSWTWGRLFPTPRISVPVTRQLRASARVTYHLLSRHLDWLSQRRSRLSGPRHDVTLVTMDVLPWGIYKDGYGRLRVIKHELVSVKSVPDEPRWRRNASNCLSNLENNLYWKSTFQSGFLSRQALVWYLYKIQNCCINKHHLGCLNLDTCAEDIWAVVMKWLTQSYGIKWMDYMYSDYQPFN